MALDRARLNRYFRDRFWRNSASKPEGESPPSKHCLIARQKGELTMGKEYSLTDGVVAAIGYDRPSLEMAGMLVRVLLGLPDAASGQIADLMRGVWRKCFFNHSLEMGRGLQKHLSELSHLEDLPLRKMPSVDGALAVYADILDDTLQRWDSGKSEEALQIAVWLCEVLGEEHRGVVKTLLRDCGEKLEYNTVEAMRQRLSGQSEFWVREALTALSEGVIRFAGAPRVLNRFRDAAPFLPDISPLSVEVVQRSLKDDCEAFPRPTSEQQTERDKMFGFLVSAMGIEAAIKWGRAELPSNVIGDIA